MVIDLANLNSGCDDTGLDEPLSLKKAKASSYLKDLIRLDMRNFNLLLRMIFESIEICQQVEQF